MFVSYCRKCHEKRRGKNFDDTIKEIEKIVGSKMIDYDCQSYCGPGRKKNFVIIDDEIIEGNSLDELLVKLKERYVN